MKTNRALITCILLSTMFPVSAMTSSVARGPSQETPQKEKQPPPKAVVKFRPEPHYPQKARDQQIEGTIVLRAIFRASGLVTDIKFDKAIPADLPEETLKALIKESIRAARKIKFEPAIKDGHAVSMYMQLEYNFRLNRTPEATP